MKQLINLLQHKTERKCVAITRAVTTHSDKRFQFHQIVGAP